MSSESRKAKLALGLNPSSNVPPAVADDSDPPSESWSVAALLSQCVYGEADPRSPAALSGNRQSHSQVAPSSEKTCSICLASLEPGDGHAVFTAECSHSFHFHCINTNVKHGNLTCPICRTIWKEIPLWNPIDPVSVGLAPSRVRLTRSDSLMSLMDIVPAHSSRRVSELNEPSVFDDDEWLNPPDHDERTTSNPSFASTSSVNAIDVITCPEVSSVERNKSLEKFTVLVHLKAASNNVSDTSFVYQPSRTPVDLVTVLDISGSMSGSKLALLKRAMGFVIQNLTSDDRLSVISFSSRAHRLFPLLRMTENGRRQALLAVNSLRASGNTNIAEGLRKGAKVMEERRVKNPVASIILLSDGQDTCTSYGENYEQFLPVFLLGDGRSGPQIHVHTFGFGSDHDASLLYSISEMSGGTFSFIETEATIQDAFAQCIGGLVSVVVQELQVGVECMHPGTRLVTLEAGSYRTSITGDGLSGYVDVGDLYAEEERDFLVSLNIPSEASAGSMTLLSVSCVYKDPITKQVTAMEGVKVTIERPETLEEGEQVISLEVDRQRSRLIAAEAMGRARAAAEAGDLRSANSVLENCRHVLASTHSAQSHDQLCAALEVELKEMQERLANRRVYESSGRAYILSGERSHATQRASTRGNSSYSLSDEQSYRTPSMAAMVRRSRTTDQSL